MFTFIDRWSLAGRLYLMQAVMLIGLLVLGGFSLLELRSRLMDEKREALQSVVQLAWKVLEQQHRQEQSGQLTREQAQQQAKAILAHLRYQGEEYLWINDMAPRMVMHPIKPELNGQDLSSFKDPNGKALFVTMVDVVKARGAGDVDYLWPKPGKDRPQDKISHVKGFEPWGWIVGSGIYIEDVDAAFWSQARATILLTLLAGGILGLLGWSINRGVRRQLGGEPAQAAAQVELFAAGDLTHPITSASDQPGNLLGALAHMRTRLHDIVAEINQGSAVLAQESGELAVSANEISRASSNQAESSAATAASVEELTVSINEVSEIARMTEQNSSKTSALAGQGAQVVSAAEQEMENIAGSVQHSAERINTLLTRSEEIGAITNVIKDIADQTNLLALNAAIEAARAGEQGRGFAVVADEVRKLAERTTGATAQISTMVNAIQSETRQAVDAMEQAQPKVRQGQTLAREASEVLQQIQHQSEDSLARAREVADATKEQAMAANTIAVHVEKIATMTEETNAATQNNAAAAEQLKELAGRLQQSMAYFKV